MNIQRFLLTSDIALFKDRNLPRLSPNMSHCHLKVHTLSLASLHICGCSYKHYSHLTDHGYELVLCQ